MDGTLTRRRLLEVTGAAGLAGVAGCLGTDDGAGAWNTHQADGANGGWIPGDGPGPSGTLETVRSGLGHPLEQYQPRTDGDRVYVATSPTPAKGESHRVIVAAYDTDGTSEWEQEVTVETTDESVSARSLSVSEGTVVLPTQRELVGFDAASGAVDWRLDREPYLTAVRDGTVYGGAGGAWAVSAGDGTEQWSTDPDVVGEGDRTPAVRAVDDDRVYLTDQSTVAAIPVEADEAAWHYREVPDESEYGRSLPRFLYTPAVSDGTVYAARTTVFERGDSGWVVALDAATGERRWRFRPDAERVVTTPPVVVDGTVYVGSSPVDPAGDSPPPSALHAVDADSGAERWSVDLSSPLVQGYPAAVGDRIYLPLGSVVAVHTGNREVETLDFSVGTGMNILPRQIASDGESLFSTSGQDMVAFRSG